MWKSAVGPDRLQMTIWRMRIACWISEATNTHSQYVILTAFRLQQWLHECGSIWHTHNAWLSLTFQSQMCLDTMLQSVVMTIKISLDTQFCVQKLIFADLVKKWRHNKTKRLISVFTKGHRSALFRFKLIWFTLSYICFLRPILYYSPNYASLFRVLAPIQNLGKDEFFSVIIVWDYCNIKREVFLLVDHINISSRSKNFWL